MTIKEAIEKLNDLERREFALHHAMGILDYDGNTVAPKLSYEPRGVTMGILAEEEYKLATGREARDVLDFLKNHTALSSVKRTSRRWRASPWPSTPALPPL